MPARPTLRGVTEGLVNSLSIVIPAYNEEATIEATVREALDVGARVCPRLEVVVVNDGSADGTGAILDRLAADTRVQVHHRKKNAGIEAAMRALYALARHEYVFLISADRQWPMESLLPMAEEVRKGADFVIGARASKRDVYTFYRLLISSSYERIVKALGAPVGDPGSIKLARAEALRLPIVSEGVFAEGERVIRAARAGFRVVACTVPFHPRRHGKATGARPQVVARALRDALRTSASLIVRWPAPQVPRLDPEDFVR